jgi:hypothetical protein
VNNVTKNTNCATLLAGERPIFVLPSFEKQKSGFMKAIIFDLDDDRFIQQAVKFCGTIDKYTDILEVDAEEVSTLKGDVKMAVFISANRESLPLSLIRHTMTELRNQLANICNACRSSRQYTREIGVEQGLEQPRLERHYFAENWGTLFDEILNANTAIN